MSANDVVQRAVEIIQEHFAEGDANRPPIRVDRLDAASLAVTLRDAGLLMPDGWTYKQLTDLDRQMAKVEADLEIETWRLRGEYLDARMRWEVEGTAETIAAVQDASQRGVAHLDAQRKAEKENW